MQGWTHILEAKLRDLTLVLVVAGRAQRILEVITRMVCEQFLCGCFAGT